MSQPIEVQEIQEQPLELPGVDGQPMRQLLLLIGWKRDLGSLERQGIAQDGRERGAQLVGDRSEEGVLHLVERPEPLGGFAFSLVGPAEGFFRLPLLGNVEEDSLPAHRPPIVVAKEHRLVTDPHHPAVGADHAVLDPPRLSGLIRHLQLLEDALSIFRVEPLDPQLRVSHVLRLGVSGESEDLRADVQDGAEVVDVIDVHDRRNLLDQVPVFGLGRSEPFLGADVLDRRAQRVRQGREEQHVVVRERASRRRVGGQDAIGPVPAGDDDGHAALDPVFQQRGIRDEPCLLGKVLGDHRSPRLERVAGLRFPAGAHSKMTDHTLAPPHPRGHEEILATR